MWYETYEDVQDTSALLRGDLDEEVFDEDAKLWSQENGLSANKPNFREDSITKSVERQSRTCKKATVNQVVKKSFQWMFFLANKLIFLINYNQISYLN